MKLYIFTIAVGLACSWGSRGVAKDNHWQVASQIGALAPNAGGQQAFTLKISRGLWEGGVFSNQYLLAGPYPLSGATFERRYPVCDTSCLWQVYVQLGGGISNAGPLALITWGTIIPLTPFWVPWKTPRYVPAFRIDITSQLIFIRWRAVSWTYPLWFGLSVPI